MTGLDIYTPTTKERRNTINVNRKSTEKTTVEQGLGHILKSLNIDTTGPTAWDYLLFGDGSGTTWNKACGWSGVLINRVSKERQVFYGAMSHGTNIAAELLAYVQPLLWLEAQELPAKPKGYRIHVLTDCQPLVSMWESKQTNGYRAIWNIFQQMERRGLVFQFHWIRRDTYQLNQLTDDLSRRARITLQEASSGPQGFVTTGIANTAAKWALGPSATLYELNAATSAKQGSTPLA